MMEFISFEGGVYAVVSNELSSFVSKVLVLTLFNLSENLENLYNALNVYIFINSKDKINF